MLVKTPQQVLAEGRWYQIMRGMFFWEVSAFNNVSFVKLCA